MLINKELEEYHSSLVIGHMVVKKIYIKINKVFLFPKMKDDIVTYIAKCDTYQRKKSLKCVNAREVTTSEHFRLELGRGINKHYHWPS